MSEQVANVGVDELNKTGTTEIKSADDKTSKEIVQKQGYYLEKVQLKTPEGGFHYWDITYTDPATLQEKYGTDFILACVNNALSARLKNRANARLPDEEGATPEAANAATLAAIAKLVAEGKTELSSQIEAEEYKPGTREKTSSISLFKEAKAALKEGNKELARELLKKAKALADAEFAMLD